MRGGALVGRCGGDLALCRVRSRCAAAEGGGEGVKERPILFSTEMVKAILEGRKSQTRRVIKPQPTMHDFGEHKSLAWEKPFTKHGYLAIGVERVRECPSCLRCSYVQPGDTLWVRETWAQENVNYKDIFIYKADGWDRSGLKWKPSIHMPRKAARIFLEVKSMRVERLQDITEEDALAEGIVPYDTYTAKRLFMNLWNTLNSKRGFIWASNPWVWVIEFERTQP